MILLDTNVVVYAQNGDAPQHASVRPWLEAKIGAGIRIGIPWPVAWGFVRIATNSRVFQGAVDIPTAWNRIQRLLDLPNVWQPGPGPDHRNILGSLLQDLGGGHKLVTDAALAAIAIEHGLTLCSCDGDFARFRGLRWENPLSPSGHRA